VLYTLLGAVIAFVVGFLIWPVHAREGLRNRLADILRGAGALYSAVAASALEGVQNEQEVRQLSQQLHDMRRGITQQMEEARSELTFVRFDAAAFQSLIEQADQVRRRLTGMAEDSSLYVHAEVEPELLPSLPVLAACTARAFDDIAEAVRSQSKETSSDEELARALSNLDKDLARLREQRVTVPFTLDRMLPFWSFVFNLRGVAEDLGQLKLNLPELA
jgi:hypothetical protein